MDANTERFSFVSFSANWPIVLLTLLCIRRTTESPWDITQNSSITRLDTSSISSFQSATHKNRFNDRSAFASSLNKPQKTHIESASVVGAAAQHMPNRFYHAGADVPRTGNWRPAWRARFPVADYKSSQSRFRKSKDRGQFKLLCAKNGPAKLYNTIPLAFLLIKALRCIPNWRPMAGGLCDCG